jgi:azurin
VKHSFVTFYICSYSHLRICIFIWLSLAGGRSIAQTDTAIVIKAITGLQYDQLRIAIRPNQKLTLILKNDDDMAHNLVITKANRRLVVVDAVVKMGDKGAENNYLPTSKTDILVASQIVLPNGSETVVFQAPATEGVYSYVCTYPGHGYVMYGALYVTTKPLPELKNDKNISKYALTQQTTSAMPHHHGTVVTPSPHPFELTYPLIYRTFMPESSPAAIAVALSATNAYCFDAGKCMLRYAWTGGFIDNADHWKGNGNALAKVIGTVYWRDNTAFPLRVGRMDSLPVVRFKGYKLNKGLPTFIYDIDDVEVQETIGIWNKNMGLVRTFKFPKSRTKAIYYIENTQPVNAPLDRKSTKNERIYTIPSYSNGITVVIKKQ